MEHVVVQHLKKQVHGGKVDVTKEQMVFAEATTVLPLIASDAYHKGEWKNRDRKNFSKNIWLKIELFIKQTIRWFTVF